MHIVFLVSIWYDIYCNIYKSWPCEVALSMGKLTSGHGHIMVQVCHVAYPSVQLDEVNTVVPVSSLYLQSSIYHELSAKKRLWHGITSDDLSVGPWKSNSIHIINGCLWKHDTWNNRSDFIRTLETGSICLAFLLLTLRRSWYLSDLRSQI